MTRVGVSLHLEYVHHRCHVLKLPSVQGSVLPASPGITYATVGRHLETHIAMD